MSGFDDFFDDEEESTSPQPQPEPAPSVQARQVTRSAADDIIEAVEGISRDKISRTCPACGSTNVAIRGSSLSGGTMRLKCRERGCRLEVPMATRQPAAAVLGPTRARSGPFYGPPKARPDKNAPPHRRALAVHEAKKNR